MILFTTLRNKAAKTSRLCMTVLLTQLNNKDAINAIKTKKRSNCSQSMGGGAGGWGNWGICNIFFTGGRT